MVWEKSQIITPRQPSKGALTTWNVLGFFNIESKAATYEFTDIAPPLGAGGLHFYRLKIMGFDGTIAYSKVISIENKEK